MVKRLPQVGLILLLSYLLLLDLHSSPGMQYVSNNPQAYNIPTPTSGTESGESVSVGATVFVEFFFTISSWLEQTFRKLSYSVSTIWASFITLGIVFGGLLMVVKGRLSQPLFIRIFFGVIILQGLLEWEAFYDFIYSPMLSFMLMVIATVLDAKDVGLVEALFSGVDGHFVAIFEAIEDYDTLLEEKGAFFEMQIFKQIIAFGLVLVFGFLYMIFVALMILGFFGFILMLAFAPLMMFIGLFNKSFFFTWLKAVATWGFIPIFTAAVMSVTVHFLGNATEAIEKLLPENSIFTAEIGMAYLIAIFSIGMHWKAPDFAAMVTGGMSTGIGSVAGTAAAVGGAGLAAAKFSGQFSGGMAGVGTGYSGAARMGDTFRQGSQKLYEQFRRGYK